MTFEESFLKAQQALGLSHYHLTFRDISDGNYASIEVDPENCIATVLFDRDRCASEQCNEWTATHEALHLALADLIHAIETVPRSQGVEQERLVRRLDRLLTKAIF